MKILGVNMSHDASACVINDGKIEFYAKEERFTGIKRQADSISNSLKLAYKIYGPNNFDYATYAWEPFTGGERYIESEKIVKDLFGLTYKEPRPLNKSTAFQHHDNHAAIAFYNSGFKESLVYVCDRNGSIYFIDDENMCRESETVYYCQYPNNFKCLEKKFWSIGNENIIKNYMDSYLKHLDIEYNYNNRFGLMRVYESATTMIDQSALENGKTMGLSSYGENLNYSKFFDENFNAIDDFFQDILTSKNGIMPVSCFNGHSKEINSKITSDNYQKYANWAKHVQIETQNAALGIIKKHVKKTGINNVCISGGYGLNIVSNAFYIKNLPEVNFYFEPLSDDSGISIGAAMNLYRQLTSDIKIYSPIHNFYHHYSFEVLKSKESDIVKDCNIEDLCDILLDQKIIAIFHGCPESGPRSLGHRSILFDPRNKNGKNIINKLKKREWYRPFAGIILEDHFEEYFHTMGLKKSEYMTINFDCKESIKDIIPTIVHVDDTCRIQTIPKENKFLYDLLSKFYELTNCPVLLNTSFNLAGKPLVQTKEDALSFMEEIDCEDYFEGVYFVEDKKLIFRGNK